MKKISSSYPEHRLYSALAICVVLMVIVIGVLIHTQKLYLRIAVLEENATARSSQLASYERSLCSGATAVEELSKYTIQSGGYERTYRVHTPANYDPSVRYPMIISFDGIEGSGERMEGYSGLDALPALVVYPDSLPGKLGFTAWQGAPYSLAGDQDVQFVSDLLSTIPSHYCVDETRVYAVGMSNGGAFATIVGCELGNQIKAVASISGAYYTSCAQEQRTPSLLVVHSTEDQQAPFRGVVKRQLPQVPQYVDQQVAARHCQTTIPSKEESLATYYSWQDCDDTSSLNFVVLHNQPHGWLALPQVSTQRAQGSVGYIWKFFEEATYNYQLF